MSQSLTSFHSPLWRYYPRRNVGQYVYNLLSHSCCILLILIFTARTEYTRMADALAQIGSNTASGKPFLFSLCQWGWVSFIYIGALCSVNNVITGASMAVRPRVISLEAKFCSPIFVRFSRWGSTLGHSWRVSLPLIPELSQSYISHR